VRFVTIFLNDGFRRVWRQRVRQMTSLSNCVVGCVRLARVLGWGEVNVGEGWGEVGGGVVS